MYDFSDGYCPECELAHNKSQMLLNDGDFWECPACHLQAKGGRLSPFFTLLRSRGGGAFLPHSGRWLDKLNSPAMSCLCSVQALAPGLYDCSDGAGRFHACGIRLGPRLPEPSTSTNIHGLDRVFRTADPTPRP